MPQTRWIVKIHVKHHHFEYSLQSTWYTMLCRHQYWTNVTLGARKVRNKQRELCAVHPLHHDSCIPNINAHICNQNHCITITLYPWQVAVDNGMNCFSQAVLLPPTAVECIGCPYQLYQLHRRCFLHWKEIWVSSISNSTPLFSTFHHCMEWVQQLHPA